MGGSLSLLVHRGIVEAPQTRGGYKYEVMAPRTGGGHKYEVMAPRTGGGYKYEVTGIQTRGTLLVSYELILGP